MRKFHGFTLVEMLVSMALLSMVLMIASTAYSQFSQRWNGRLGHFNHTVKQAKHLVLVQEALQSIVPYVVTDEQNQAKYYFEGNRNGFVAVTLRSIFNPDVAAVIRLQLTQNEDFSFTLVYQESPMTEQLLISATQAITFDYSIVLFDRITNADFQYFGWPSVSAKFWTPDSTNTTPVPKEWFEEYDSLQLNLQPEQIKITFLTQDGEFTVQAKVNDAVPGVLSTYSSQQ